jgi:hypothetical protein
MDFLCAWQKRNSNSSQKGISLKQDLEFPKMNLARHKLTISNFEISKETSYHKGQLGKAIE